MDTTETQRKKTTNTHHAVKLYLLVGFDLCLRLPEPELETGRFHRLNYPELDRMEPTANCFAQVFDEGLVHVARENCPAEESQRHEATSLRVPFPEWGGSPA